MAGVAYKKIANLYLKKRCAGRITKNSYIINCVLALPHTTLSTTWMNTVRVKGHSDCGRIFRGAGVAANYPFWLWRLP